MVWDTFTGTERFNLKLTCKNCGTTGGDTLTVTTPNGGESWKPGKRYTIKWNKGNAGTFVKIQLLKSGRAYKTITGRTTNDGNHPWTIPSTITVGSQYKIKITSSTNRSRTDSSDQNFTISKIATVDSGGTVKVTSPNGGESWKLGKRYLIKWDKGNAGAFVRIFLQKSGRRYKTISQKTANDGQHPWTVPKTIASSSTYKIRVQSVTRRTVYDDSDSNFTIGKAGGGTLTSGNYKYLNKHNAYRYSGRVARWASTRVSVSGASGDLRDAVNRWPKLRFNFVGSRGDIDIKWGDSTDWCGLAYTYVNSSREIYKCNIKINREREWEDGESVWTCGDYTNTVTHEIGHCIGLFKHTSDGGLMDATAAGSNELTSHVRSMINLLYSLSPGTNIRSKLSLPVRMRARSASGQDSTGSDVITFIDYPTKR